MSLAISSGLRFWASIPWASSFSTVLRASASAFSILKKEKFVLNYEMQIGKGGETHFSLVILGCSIMKALRILWLIVMFLPAHRSVQDRCSLKKLSII